MVKDKIITPIAKQSLTGEIKWVQCISVRSVANVRDGQVVKIELVDGAISITSDAPAGALETTAEEATTPTRPEARTLELLDEEDHDDDIGAIEPDEIRRPAA